MKRQLKRLASHFSGKYVSLSREFVSFGNGDVEVQFSVYVAGTSEEAKDYIIVNGKSSKAAVDAALRIHAEREGSR